MNSEELFQFVVSQLLQYGRVRRSWIGIAGQNVPLPRRLVYEYKLPVDTAIVVNEVYKGSSAEQAGVHPGDIILSFGTNSIASIDELHRLLTSDASNRSVPIIVLRGIERHYLSIGPLSKEN